MSKVEVIPLFRVNIENGCPAFPALPSNYHLTWPNITPHYCLPGKCISECFIECCGWMEIVRSVPSALIILTWKRDSHPTSQGSLTPGKREPVFWIRDPHHGTKDLTSPVSSSAQFTDGNWNFTWLRLRLPPPPTSHKSHNTWSLLDEMNSMIFVKEIPPAALWLQTQRKGFSSRQIFIYVLSMKPRQLISDRC